MDVTMSGESALGMTSAEAGAPAFAGETGAPNRVITSAKITGKKPDCLEEYACIFPTVESQN